MADKIEQASTVDEAHERLKKEPGPFTVEVPGFKPDERCVILMGKVGAGGKDIPTLEARMPLSYETIKNLWLECPLKENVMDQIIEFARHIERMHNIGG